MVRPASSLRDFSEAAEYGLANNLRYVFYDSKSKRLFCSNRRDKDVDRATKREFSNISYEGACW